MGYAQIDTISVVARAHEHVLWTRLGSWADQPYATLEGAQPARGRGPAPARRVFEYWAHAAAYLPLDEYRWSLPRMERVRAQGHDWFEADRAAAAEVLARIRAEGPLGIGDLDEDEGPRGQWWDWKPAKRAAEFLFQAGELLVARRRGFAKVFDLPERVIPPETDKRCPAEAEMAAHYLDRAEAAYGVFAREEAAYLRRELTGGVDAELAARLESGRLEAFRVEGAGAKTYYAAPAAVQAAALAPAGRVRAYVLSPFDPFLIDRRRMERLFGFGYAIECYLPAAKRRFGYFALPVLAVGGAAGAGSFIGLLDAKADRAARTLILRRFALGAEARCAPLAGRAARSLAKAAGRAVADFAFFNGAERVVAERLDLPSPGAEAAFREALG